MAGGGGTFFGGGAAELVLARRLYPPDAPSLSSPELLSARWRRRVRRSRRRASRSAAASAELRRRSVTCRLSSWILTLTLTGGSAAEVVVEVSYVSVRCREEERRLWRREDLSDAMALEARAAAALVVAGVTVSVKRTREVLDSGNWAVEEGPGPVGMGRPAESTG